MNEVDNAAVLNVLERYKAAVFAKDVEAFVALYAADIHVFDTWAEWSREGIEAWRGVAVEWFGSLGDERVVVDFSEVRARVTPEFASLNAFVRYAAIDRQDRELRSMSNRLTMVLRPVDAGGAGGPSWKVVHEHTSAPVDPDTGKVILTR